MKWLTILQMKAPVILAIETSTPSCSAALIVGDLCLSRCQMTQMGHTELILPMIQSLLEEARLSISDLDLIAVGRGPGSFTGVRIAVSTAQGLGFGLNIPVYPISTLEALAYQALNSIQRFQADEILILSAIDARMQEIYLGKYLYQSSNHSRFENYPEALCSAEIGDLNQRLAFEMENHPDCALIAIGEGWKNLSVTLSPSMSMMLPEAYPHAKEIALIANEQLKRGISALPAKEVLPVYLRDNVAHKI